MKKPSAGALRAANEICDKTGPEYSVRYDDESILEIAQIIDEVTGLAELVEAVQEVLEYLDQRADCSTDNPAIPNEEMRLWEELNNALAAARGKETG